jgi:hypothetical protein
MRQSQPAPTARGSRWTSAMETCRPRALQGGRPPTARNQGTRANTKRAAQSPPQGHRTATHSPLRYERATDRSSTRVSPNPGSNRIVACAKLNDARALHRRSPNHPVPRARTGRSGAVRAVPVITAAPPGIVERLGMLATPPNETIWKACAEFSVPPVAHQSAWTPRRCAPERQ